MNPILAVNWLKDELKFFIVEDRSFTKYQKISSAVGEWKSLLHSLSQEERKIQIKTTLQWLIQDQTLGINETKECLHFLEKIVLSRKVTNLACKKFYDHIVDNHSNQVITLNGLQTYISFHYPELIVYYLVKPKDLNLHNIEEDLKRKNSIWIVLQHGKNLHKTLFHISSKDNTNVIVQIFDSLGVTHQTQNNPNDDNKLKFKNNLCGILTFISPLFTIGKIEELDQQRQIDKTSCSAFILHDLETALSLIGRQIPLFIEESNYSKPHPAFFNITQTTDLNHNSYGARPIFIKDEEKYRNSTALIIAAHAMQFFLHCTSTYTQEDGNTIIDDSDNDEKENTCILL